MNCRNKSSFVFLISWLLSSSAVLSASKDNEYKGGKPCQMSQLGGCSENEACTENENDPKTGICHCLQGYERVKEDCIPTSGKTATTTDNPPVIHTPLPSTQHESQLNKIFAVWVIIPCMFAALLGSLVLIVKRYKLIDRLYQLRVRRYNTVLVSSLNDDDAPIQ